MKDPKSTLAIWKSRFLVVVALFIALFGVKDLFIFLESPYVGIYGEYVSRGYMVYKVVNVKSTEPMTPGMFIWSMNGVDMEEWVQSFAQIPPASRLVPKSGVPLDLEVGEESRSSIQKITVFPHDPSLSDLLDGPFRAWILAAFVLFCGTYLLLRYPEQDRVRILSMLLLATSLSIINNSGKHLLLYVSPRFPILVIIRLGAFCVIFSSWLYLILIFLEKRKHLQLQWWMSWALYVVPLMAAALMLLAGWNQPLSGVIRTHRVLFLMAVGVVIFTFGILVRAYRTSEDAVLKAQLKWILWGHTLGMSPYILFYSLPRALTGTPWIAYNTSLLPFPLIIFAYFFAFYRYRLMDVDRVIHGSIVYGISVALLFLLYLGGLSVLHGRMAEPSTWGSWGRADLLLLLGAALIFNPLKNLVWRGIDRALFPEKQSLPNLLMEGSHKLSRAANSEELADFLIHELPGRIMLDRGALVLRQQFGEGWEFHSQPKEWIKNENETLSSLEKLSREPPAPYWNTWAEEEAGKDTDHLAFFRAKGAAMVFPLKSLDDLWGFFIISEKANKRLLASEEIHVISTLCVQAANRLGNVRLLEGLQKTNRSLSDLSHRLMQAERMADLGEGAATLAHELKTPLGILRGSAEVLQKIKDPSEQGKILKFIMEEVDRLAGTVDEFLQFARMSPPSKADTPLNDLVQSAAYLWESRRKSTIPFSIRFQLDPDVGKVALDSRQVYQVLLNIFTNSAEAMPEGGELQISTGVDTGREKVWVLVKDTGRGISPDHLPKVFERFFTTKESGLGLGLPVVKKIMEDHGGSVAIESAPGNGTEVALFFPGHKAGETQK